MTNQALFTIFLKTLGVLALLALILYYMASMGAGVGA